MKYGVRTLIVGAMTGILILGCGNQEAKRLDQEFRSAMESGNPVEAYSVLGRIQAQGLTAESRLTALEKAQCYVGYAEKVLPEDYDRALETAELARQSIQQVAQSGQPVPPELDQRFKDLYGTLVQEAPENLARPELQRVRISPDLPEQLVVDRTRPLDTQILELLVAQGLKELEEQNRELAERNQELEDQSRELQNRVEGLTGPVTDLDERMDRVSERLGGLDQAEQGVNRLEQSVARITKDTQDLRTELQQAVKDLESLRTTQGATAGEVQKIQDRLVRLINQAEGIEKQVDGVDTRLAQFEQGVMLDNLFRDGLAAYNRGDSALATEKLSAYLKRAPEDDAKAPEAAAVLGVIHMDEVRNVISREDRTVSRKDVEAAQANLDEARAMLARAEEKIDEIESARLQESVKRELARVDDYSRELMRK